jgi:D-threonate/D-erythronate kinase
MRLAIIADDLTGAMDAAAPFAERGLAVTLVLSAAAEMAPAAMGDVVAFDTSSRHLPPAEAAAAVARCVAALPRGTPLFKKIDSTLRGAVVEEIRAAAAGRGTIVIAPAVPAQGRTVRGGQVLVHGVPVSAAESDGDARQRRFAGSLAAALAPWPCAMPDCATEGDLAAIARTAPAGALLVGAAGLAQAVAQIRFGDATAAARPAPAGPALFVAGSRTAITAHQLAHLRQARPAAAIETPPAAPEADAGAVARRLAQCAVARLRRIEAGALVLIGGDTARAVLDALGVQALRVRGHIIPAIPWGEAEIGDRSLVVATKAGGFGAPDALSRIAERLSAARPASPA